MAEGEQPAPAGKALHQDARWRFEFWYPADWRRFSLTEERQGVLYAPDSADLAASFSVEVKDLGLRVRAKDLDDLQAGFRDGLRTLTECQVEMEERWSAGHLIGLEARYTFREQGALRKRWVRLIFAGRRQFHLIAQGASPAEYEHWLPALTGMMLSVKIE